MNTNDPAENEGKPSLHKQSVYFPDELLRELQEQATRQNRSLSSLVQQAWRLARPHLARVPGTDELGAPVSLRRR